MNFLELLLLTDHDTQPTGYRKHFDPEIMEKKVRSLNKKLEKANTFDADSKAGRLSEGETAPSRILFFFIYLLLLLLGIVCRFCWRRRRR